MAKKKKKAKKAKKKRVLCRSCNGKKGRSSSGDEGDGRGDPRSTRRAGQWVRCYHCKGTGTEPKEPRPKPKKKRAFKKMATKKAKKTRLKRAKKLIYEEELALEQEVVSNLVKLERDYDDRAQSSVKVRALIRAYRRKHNESDCHKETLIGIKEFLTECWDEEEEHFDASYARHSGGHYVPGHWCANLIEEIGEATEDGTVYTPLKVKV